jgi:uncharacterized protein (TIGR02147 family)
MLHRDLDDTQRRESFVAAAGKVLGNVSAMSYIDFKPYLEAVYRGLKQYFGKYTYIEFAHDLGFARTNVIHRIIKGKRPLTVKSAERIADALEMGPLARRYFTTMVEYLYSNDAAKRSDLFNQMLQMKNQVVRSNMSRSQLSYFSEWYHPVVREMISLKHFKPDPAWIAQKMRPHIRKDQAEKSVKLLQDLGLLTVTPDGKVEATAANVTTGDEVKSIALVRYHYAVIDLARNAIPSVEPKMRDVSAVTISVSQDTVKEIKAEIQAFRKKLLAIADKAADKSMVYQVNFQMFPLTF